MTIFETKLDRVLRQIPHVLREAAGSITLYKGISRMSGYERYPHQVGQTGTTIPGFLSTYEIGLVYSEPELTGTAHDKGLIYSVEINPQEVEDRTDAFVDWCNRKGQDLDISLGFPKEWRDGAVWTVSIASSAHGGVSCFGDNDFIFCGIPKTYTIIRHYNNQDEWEQDAKPHFSNKRIQEGREP